MMRIKESDYQLAKLIRFLCVGDEKSSGSQTRSNPYCVPAIREALHYLGGEYGISYLDAAEWVIAEYKLERHID